MAEGFQVLRQCGYAKDAALACRLASAAGASSVTLCVTPEVAINLAATIERGIAPIDLSAPRLVFVEPAVGRSAGAFERWIWAVILTMGFSTSVAEPAAYLAGLVRAWGLSW